VTRRCLVGPAAASCYNQLVTTPHNSLGGRKIPSKIHLQSKIRLAWPGSDGPSDRY